MPATRLRVSSSTAWVILFAVAAGVGIGFAVAMGLARTVEDPGAGDWLSAAGVLVGIVASVAAAVWIEDRKRTADLRTDMRMMADALEALKAAMQRQCAPIADGHSLASVRIITDYEALVEAIETATFVREQLRPSDVLLWRRVREVERHWQQVRIALADRATTRERGALSEVQLRNDRDELHRFALGASPLVEAALSRAAGHF